MLRTKVLLAAVSAACALHGDNSVATRRHTHANASGSTSGSASDSAAHAASDGRSLEHVRPLGNGRSMLGNGGAAGAPVSVSALASPKRNATASPKRNATASPKRNATASPKRNATASPKRNATALSSVAAAAAAQARLRQQTPMIAAAVSAYALCNSPIRHVCRPGLPKLRYAMAAAGAMDLDLPRRALVVLILFVAAIGIAAERRARVRDALERAYAHVAALWSQEFPMSAVYAPTTMKLFVSMLLSLELLYAMAPEQDILATPEVVRLVRAHPSLPSIVPKLTRLLLPTLDEDSADAYVWLLRNVRMLLLGAWVGFLLLPAAHYRLSTALYAVGALCYVYLGSLGLQYDLSHSTQAPMIFVLGAAFAIPGLSTNVRASYWLRTYLFVCVLLPAYSFAGLSKLRYDGVWANLSGTWIPRVLQPEARTIWPVFNLLIAESTVLSALFSWGNLLVEIVLPVAAVFVTRGRVGVLARALFLFAAIIFHVTVLLTMGPNFCRLALLDLLAADLVPVAVLISTHGVRDAAQRILVLADAPPPLAPPTAADAARALVAIATLALWFSVQLSSDFEHILGRVSASVKPNPYWPFPEMSMFTRADAQSEYCTAFALSLSLILALCVKYALSARRDGRGGDDDGGGRAGGDGHADGKEWQGLLVHAAP